MTAKATKPRKRPPVLYAGELDRMRGRDWREFTKTARAAIAKATGKE